MKLGFKIKKRVWVFMALSALSVLAVEIGNERLASWIGVGAGVVSIVVRWVVLLAWMGSFPVLLTGIERIKPPDITNKP